MKNPVAEPGINYSIGISGLTNLGCNLDSVRIEPVYTRSDPRDRAHFVALSAEVKLFGPMGSKPLPIGWDVDLCGPATKDVTFPTPWENVTISAEIHNQIRNVILDEWRKRKDEYPDLGDDGSII